jgi:hypothetical protein
LCTHYRSLVWIGLTSCPCRHRILVSTDPVSVHSDQVSYSGEMEVSLTVLSVLLMLILTSVVPQTLCVLQCAHMAAVIWNRIKISQNIHLGQCFSDLMLISTSKNWGMEARSSITGWGTVLQAGSLWVQFLMKSLDSFNWSNRSAALWPGVDSASNKNRYQESSWG